jgi:ribose 5-phosphate isomerase A
MGDPKREAGERAALLVQSGMVVGLGTGSTAAHAVEAIGRRIATGSLKDIVGIPTSDRTRELAERLGIPLTTLNDRPQVDLTIDGADEVDPSGDLIKGGGGALLWEKIVAAASRRYVIIVDSAKLVERLGERFPLPVEVVPFGWRTHLDAIRTLGAEPVLRTDRDEQPVLTDGGHVLLDCRFPSGIENARLVERVLRARPGVVETGLFLGMQPQVIVGAKERT